MSAKELAIQKSDSPFQEKLKKLVLWQRVAILAGLIVLLVGAAVWFLFLPQYEEISQLDEKLQGLEKKLATAKVNAAELGKFQAKMQEAEAQFKIAMRALPENQEIPSLLTSISKSGQEVGLEFLLFEPKPETRREFYAEIPVAMSLRGDYHNLAVFFDKVARLSRIVNINNISVTPGKDGRELNTACFAVTYKFVEPLPEKPAAPAANRPRPRPRRPSRGAASKRRTLKWISKPPELPIMKNSIATMRALFCLIAAMLLLVGCDEPDKTAAQPQTVRKKITAKAETGPPAATAVAAAPAQPAPAAATGEKPVLAQVAKPQTPPSVPVPPPEPKEPPPTQAPAAPLLLSQAAAATESSAANRRQAVHPGWQSPAERHGCRRFPDCRAAEHPGPAALQPEGQGGPVRAPAAG